MSYSLDKHKNVVIPAEAGIQEISEVHWILVFAEMTEWDGNWEKTTIQSTNFREAVKPTGFLLSPQAIRIDSAPLFYKAPTRVRPLAAD